MIFAVLELCAIAFLVTFFVTQILLPLIYRTPVCPWFKKSVEPPIILRVPYPDDTQVDQEKQHGDTRE